MQMKYSWILFDADGTLFDYDGAEAFALETTLTRHDIPFEPTIVSRYREINGKLFRDLENNLVSADELKVKRFQLLFEAISNDADAVAFSKDYLVNLSKFSELLPGALNIVKDLQPLCKMLIITNGLTEVQRPRFGRSEIMQFFKDVVISDEVGSAKPAPGIFEVAFNKMGNPAKSDVLIVGDSLSSDIAGGNNFGIDTCWFNPSGKSHENNLEISYEISDLQELLGVVKTV